MFANLDTEHYDRKYTDRQLIGRMTTYFRPHSRALALVVGLSLFTALASAAYPLLVARGVDWLREEASNQVLTMLFTAVFAVGLLNWASNWLRRRLTVRAIANIELKLREDAFRAAASHDLAFYDENSSGRIVSRITSDTKEFGQVVVLVTDLASQFIQAAVLLVVLMRIEWRLSLVLVVFLPLVFLAASGFRALARAVTRTGMRAMANVNAVIKETISGIAVAKNFRQEQAVFAEFDGSNRQSYQVNVRRGLVFSLVFPVLNAMGGVAMAVLVYAGGLSAAAGAVSAGAWYLFIQSLDRFFFPVLNLSAFWAQIQGGLSAAERIFALMDARSAVVQTAEQRVVRLKGDIRFENVFFRYGERQQVLEDFSLHVRPGETVALVGHTGAGKSSIAKLVARFYEFQQGRILIDGQDIRELHLPAYRSFMGIVPQQPFLFSATVAENICYACPTDTELAYMEGLARKIGNGEWLDALPQGLNTQVGERGARLSQGQRQLVSLMRVLVQQPSIFILDEATASIDPFTEWQIQQALKLILSKTTSILIAHRLSTVKAADRIIVLRQGRIIEEGTHDGLLLQSGHYAELYNTYFRHQSLDYRPTGLEEHLQFKLQSAD